MRKVKHAKLVNTDGFASSVFFTIWELQENCACSVKLTLNM